MRTKTIALLAALVAAVLLVATPVGAQAAKLITGKQIRDGSVTGKDIKNGSLTGKDVAESTLGTVPSAKKATTATTAGTADSAQVADGLSTLAPGESQSGAFSAAGPTVDGLEAGYLGFAITYARPLAEPIAEDHIVDTTTSPDPVLCPGPGQAAPGYLCFYSNERSGIDYIYGYSDSGPYAQTPQSVGVGLYAEVTGEYPYVDGVWTVTAPELS